MNEILKCDHSRKAIKQDVPVVLLLCYSRWFCFLNLLIKQLSGAACIQCFLRAINSLDFFKMLRVKGNFLSCDR